MAWLQLTFEIDDAHADLLSEYLSDAGALAVTMQDAKDHPLFEPKPEETPLWPTTTVTGLFEAHSDLIGIKKYLKKNLLASFDEQQTDSILNSLRIENLEDQNWVQASLDQFKPLHFGKRLWIIPSWHEDKKILESIQKTLQPIIIKLDPGLAFGTGTHETTALCLEWLDAHPPRGCLVIDYGSGSGILSLAAVMLGATRVIAVDHDKQALQSTRNNAEKNGITESQLMTTTPELFNRETQGNNPRADLILANILADPIIELIPRFATLLKPGGDLVLSGILTTQSTAITARLQEYNFQDIEVESKGDWARVSCKKIY